jgi:hypothetical protein
MKTILRPSGESSFVSDAIRDLVVVVVGILAAVYLESWWQDGQDRAEEGLLLRGLRAEFIENKSQLTEKISYRSRTIDAADQAMQYMGMDFDGADAATVIRTFRGTSGMQFFDPRTGQLSSLIFHAADEIVALIDNRLGQQPRRSPISAPAPTE